MCIDCGCSKENNNIAIATHQHKIEINRGILSKNDRLAEQNRNLFAEQKLLVVNLLSSPGSGKTALIEQLLQSTGEELNIGVIVGDLATDNDARRLQNKGAPAIQITTGNACHLEAEMVAQAAKQLDLASLELLIIENVGNLVCPAAYDLGEDLRIVLLSVTEGEDKPLKYPLMFKSAQIVVINKIDLAEAVEFDLDRAIANIYKTAPQAKIFQTSAKTGRGMDSLLSYLSSSLEVKTLSQTNQN